MDKEVIDREKSLELEALQICDNCSIGNVEACVLRRCDGFAIDEELTEEEEKYLCRR